MNKAISTPRVIFALICFAAASLTAAAAIAPPAPSAARFSATKVVLGDASSGRNTTLQALLGRNATVLFFTSTECPVALAYEQELARGSAALAARGVALVAVNSNSTDTRARIVAHRNSAKLPYPTYKDEGGGLADALGVTRSSEVVLLNARGSVTYQGRIDDRISVAVRRATATTHELREALEATLASRPVATPRTEASGCLLTRTPVARGTAAVTYSKDVAPIVQRYCVTCHSPGQAGPMSLQSYEQVAAWSRMIVEVLRQNRMPPSRLAPPDPRYGEFIKDPEPTPEEIATLAKWVEAGTPRGEATATPPAPATASGRDTWLIGKPDMILEMPRTHEIPANGVVPYQYFELLNYSGEERWVEAIEIKPGARSVVHHANVYMSQPELLTVGFDFGERWASFAPGRPPTTFPAGVARRLPDGARLTLEMHYTPDGAARADRTRIGLRFTRTPPRYEARSIPLGNLNFRIPPHAANHAVTATYTLKGDGKIASFTPHMHDRGKDFRYEAILPDGRVRTLLFVPKYEFKWQFVYVPKEMISLPKGTVLRAIAHYDNSAGNPTNPDPDATVTFGLQTYEEMMFGFIDLVYDEAPHSPKLRDLRAADRRSLPRDRGFNSWEELEANMQAFRARSDSK